MHTSVRMELIEFWFFLIPAALPLPSMRAKCCFLMGIGLISQLISGTVVIGQNRVTRFPHEVTLGLGHTIYKGDLPSTSVLASGNFKTIKLETVNAAAMLGYSYRFHKKWSFRHNLSALTFSGNDKLDKEGDKVIRNLSFRTQMIEYTPLLEFSILHWDIQTWNMRHHVYVATGLSMFFFNPQAELNGKYYNLQPLSTEGQGFTGASLPYSRFSASLPLMAGYRFRMSERWIAGFEASFRKSFTDYLDDVSKSYYDNNVIRVNRGEAAAALADRNLKGSPAQQGTARGNPAKEDNYAYGVFTITRMVGR